MIGLSRCVGGVLGLGWRFAGEPGGGGENGHPKLVGAVAARRSAGVDGLSGGSLKPVINGVWGEVAESLVQAPAVLAPEPRP